MRRIEPICETALIACRKKIRRSRNGHFEWCTAVLFCEGHFMSRELPDFLELRSRRKRRTSFRASAGSLPFQDDSLRNKPLDGLRHVRKPRPAAHLAVRENIDSNLPLLLEYVRDGLIFFFSQFLQRNLRPRISGARLKQRCGTQ